MKKYISTENPRSYNNLKYPTNLLQEALEKVKKMDRLQLLRQSNKKQPDKIRLITHYNPSNPNFDQIL